MQTMDWERDYLPEFLWIAALAEKHGINHFHVPYNAFLDEIDKVWDHEAVALGLLSDFQLVPEGRRDSFLDDNELMVEELFHRPIGRILAFYPDCPASWLVQKRFLEGEGHLDPGTELGELRALVVRLLPGKTDFPAQVRAVPLNRLLKHRKILFSEHLEVVKAIPKYPHECDEHEKFIVESMARTSINMSIQNRKDLADFKWSQYFWRHNYDLTACNEMEFVVQGGRVVAPSEGQLIQEILIQNGETARAYLDLLRRRFRPDLYDPTKDEIFFGLFGRMTRLFCLLMEDPNLWARDVGGILLRCLADTAITFGYLVTNGTPDEVKKFIEYGEGQQKLLMLHLQDNYPEEQSLEGLSAKQLAEKMGRFTPELLDIELGHWSKKNSRLLAKDAGMERLYRLVYSPTSGDIHGSWLSLKNSNLTHCAEPLHRYHRLPTFAEPPFFINIAEVACDLYQHSVSVAIQKLDYPEQETKLRSLYEITETEEDQDSEEMPEKENPTSTSTVQ